MQKSFNSVHIEHYLTDCLYYEIGTQEIESIKIFSELITKINHNEINIHTRSVSSNKKEIHEGIQQLYPREESLVR